MKERNSYYPTVIDNENMSEKAYDVISRLMKDRVVFLNGEVNDESAASIVAQLLYLEANNEDEDIYMYINSPGGTITSGMAIYDTMNFIKCDIRTICIGQACSMGSFLLSAGTKGKRFSLPSSRIMIHQPLGGAEGQASDIQIQAKEIQRLKDILNGVLAENTGQPLKRIVKDTDRDNFMSAYEAKEYGLIDHVLVSRKESGI